MSKSVGNIFQLSEAIERYGGQTVVAYLASGHYRQPLAFSDEQLTEAAARVERIRNYFRDAPAAASRTRSWSRSARPSSTPSPTTSTRRRPSPCSSRSSPRETSGSMPGAREVLDGAPAAARARFVCSTRTRRPPGEARAPARRARAGPRGEGLRARRRAPRRARRDGLGGPRRGGRRLGWCGAGDRLRFRVFDPRIRGQVHETLMRERIYGRRPVAEAERGRRRVHRVWRAPDTPAGGARAALRVARPPGGGGGGGSLSLRRPGRSARRRGRPGRRPRPDPGPAQSRRGLPGGRGRRRLRGGDPRASRGFGDTRGRARRRRARSSTCRWRGCSNLADWLAEAKRAGGVGLRGGRGGRASVHGRRLVRARRPGTRVRGLGAPLARGGRLRRADFDPGRPAGSTR